jgi:anti-sigma regulatory factor (Ser/Thr protein kinase)/anti-anti-sigma regulatory factor
MTGPTRRPRPASHLCEDAGAYAYPCRSEEPVRHVVGLRSPAVLMGQRMVRWGGGRDRVVETGQYSMIDGLTFEVVAGHPVVLCPSGVLTATTGPQLRTALLSCLADQPAALVVDASSLALGPDADDEIGLLSLGNAARESQRWPGTRIAVAARAELHQAAARLGIQDAVDWCPDLTSAVTELGGVATPPTARERIVPDRDAPSHARAAVQAFCERQRVGGDRDAAQLVASELVTNAVVHAGTTIDLTLRLVSPLLHIAVRDLGSGHPRITDIDESAESGRGLMLVDALASSWGTFFPDTGKVVWATVRVRSLL